jgi:hypothetical protein
MVLKSRCSPFMLVSMHRQLRKSAKLLVLKLYKNRYICPDREFRNLYRYVCLMHVCFQYKEDGSSHSAQQEAVLLTSAESDQAAAF